MVTFKLLCSSINKEFNLDGLEYFVIILSYSIKAIYNL